MTNTRQSHWMQHALELAQQAANYGEVPVGAVVVKDNQIIGQGFNQPIAQHDPSAHAEIIAIREAGKTLSNYRLLNAELYVTLEPCAMCASALVHARISHIIFGAKDPKTGVISSVDQIYQRPYFNHQPQWTGGVLADECSLLLKNFFGRRRKLND